MHKDEQEGSSNEPISSLHSDEPIEPSVDLVNEVQKGSAPKAESNVISSEEGK